MLPRELGAQGLVLMGRAQASSPTMISTAAFPGPHLGQGCPGPLTSPTSLNIPSERYCIVAILLMKELRHTR